MDKKLQSFIAQANKEIGDNAAVIIDENFKIDVEVIPTGIEVVDNAIGVGGIPRGRITEVYGMEGCGKTTLCLHTIAQAHKMGLNCAFIDAEHSLSIERIKALGVDTQRLVLHQPDTGEQALEFVEMAVRDNSFGVIVIDSVAALVPSVEVDKDMGDSVMGVHARLMSQAMRKLTAPIAHSKTAVMFTNQIRAKIGGYGVAETTTGGNALKFYASLRLKIALVGRIKDSSGNQISGKYKLTVIKNKVAVPYKVAEFEINSYGIDELTSLVDELTNAGILVKSGSFYKLDGEVLGQGKQAVGAKLRNEPELKEKVRARLQEGK